MKNETRETVSFNELYPVIQEVLATGGEFTVYPGGTSMLPTIRPAEDAVVLTAPQSIRVGDIILYRRDSGVFVLHRVVKVKKDGSLVTRGDNQFYSEMGVLPSQVIAVVARYYKGEKAILRGSAREKRIFLSLRLRYGAKRVLSAAKRRLGRPMGGRK